MSNFLLIEKVGVKRSDGNFQHGSENLELPFSSGTLAGSLE